MPTITDTFTISDGDTQRPAIRTLNQQDPLVIAVDLWTQQGTRGDKDYDLLSASAIIAGSTAQAFLDNFQAGDTVQISGELVVEQTQDGYLNVEIEKARWSFVPSGRDTAQQPQQTQQQQNAGGPQPQPQQGRPPNGGGNPQPNRGGGGGGGRPPSQPAPQPQQNQGGGGQRR